MRVQCVLLIGLCGLSVATVVFAGSNPVAVSPGDSAKLVLIADPCPTFSWGAIAGSKGYELVAYRIGEEGEEARPVLTEAFPGSASSWTPSLDRCLERGGQYAWSVRALGGEGELEWSTPSLFQVASGPSAAEFEAALQVVRSYLDAGGGVKSAGGMADETHAESEAASGPEGTGPSPVPRVVSTTQLSVDGGVVATSFTGDGSTLTSLDPTNLSAGTAAIDISGTAATASDLVGAACVSESELDFDPTTQTEMTTHVGSMDAHREHATLEESAEIDADIAGHSALPNAHHIPPTSLPPSGAAGGDLTGSYPNPAIASGAVGLGEMQGSFCLVRNGTDACPAGYTNRYLRWDTENTSNSDVCGPPAWYCGASEIGMNFCCK